MRTNVKNEEMAPLNNPHGSALAVSAEPGEEEAKPLSVYAIAGIALFISLIVSLSVAAGYNAIFGQKTRIGVVDIAGVLETSELVFTEMLSGDNVSDADREAAYELVRETGPKLDAAIVELQNACECVLLTKAAVIGSEAIDYTPQIKAKLGIDKADVKELQASIRRSMKAKESKGDER